MFRRPIFVIVGATNLGKSLLAADVLRKVARVLDQTPNDSQPASSGDAAQQPYLEVTVGEHGTGFERLRLDRARWGVTRRGSRCAVLEKE